ncbi:cystatin domain-containing protein [Ditylenchus destructor]|uniref:Cystatin domain-containing protein n=1 Tax=Ditylenchus destructor TaxID=166010 RepID=A0AAD4MFQ6_9BILA|nr:cystatin domain-containing protein [Ditylenchus destructor]
MTRYIFASFCVIVAGVIFVNTKTTTEEPAPGDASPLDAEELQSPEILNYTQHAVKKVNNDPSNERGKDYRKLVKILDGTSQAISGTRYTIRFLLGKTNCKAKEVENLGSDEHCQLKEDALELYVATILSAPWEKYDGEITVNLVGPYNDLEQ